MDHHLLRVLVCFVAAGLQAQTARQGTLSGNLGGLAGKSNAVIILTDVNSGVVTKITPVTDGSFTIALPPGTYRIEVERDGFRQTARQNVEIASGVNAQLNVTIEGGPTIEAIEVKAQAPATQDDPPEIGRGYTSTIVRTLPVLDRNYQQLIGLMPGVTPPVSSYPLTFDPQGNRQFNTNGLPAYANDHLSDGISIREAYTGQLAIRVLPDESVQQLNVQTSNYPVNSGYAAGALGNVFQRPGTNGLHGSAFGFFTDNFFRTRNPLSPPGLADPSIHDRQFGGTIGGALIPDRMFWFMSYQGAIHNGRTLQFATVPTAAELGGNFSGLGFPVFNPATGTSAGAGRTPFTNGIIPTALQDPVARAYLGFLPGENFPGAANNLAANVPFGDRSHMLDGKLDYRFSETMTGFFRYGWSHYNAHQDSIFGPVIGDATRDSLRNHHASASLAANYHGIIGEFRVGYSRYRNLISPNSDPTALAQQLSTLNFANGSSVPSVSIAGLGTLGTPIGLPTKDVNNNYEGAANFNLYRGGNQFAFGVDIRDLTASGFPALQFGPAGSFFFGPGPTSSLIGTTAANSAFPLSVASFLTGAPTTRGVFSLSDKPSYNQRWYAGFIQDTLRIRRVAVNIGLRYEVYSPVSSRGPNGFTTFDPATSTVTTSGQFGDYNYSNVAPRIGLAFRLTEHTAIRTSYAIHMFPLPFGLLPIGTTGAGTSQGIVGSFGSTPFTVPPTPASAASSGSPAPNIPLFSNALSRTPYSQNYFFMIQQAAPWGFLADAAYVGHLSRELPYVRSINAALPGTGLAGVPFISAGNTAPIFEEGNGLTSNYNALQLNITKRLSKGAAFAIAYTYSKTLDYGTTLLDPFDLRNNHGRADWDRPHMLTISHVFDLPFGAGTDRWNQGIAGMILGNWQINGLFHFATGAPYNILADPLSCACPGLPAVFASAAGTSSMINGSASFNPALFTSPAPGTLGTVGRNSVRGPDLTVYNLSVFKSFAMAENRKIELRGEAYNLLNSSQFGNPYSNVSFSNFGQPTGASSLNGLFGGGGRLFVLGARFLF